MEKTLLDSCWTDEDRTTSLGLFRGIVVGEDFSIFVSPRGWIKLSSKTERSGRWGQWGRRRELVDPRIPDHSCPPRGGLMKGWESECCGVGGIPLNENSNKLRIV